MSADTDIITIEAAQHVIGDSSQAGEALTQEGITVLTGAFNAFCGYQLVSKEYEDQVVRGGGSDLLVLPAHNVTAVSSVKYRSAKSSWTALQSAYWELDDITAIGVRGYGYTFALGALFKVTFTAGWSQSAMPGDIVEAFIHELRRYIGRRYDVQGANLGGQSGKGTTYRDITDQTRRTLLKYALVGI